MMYIQDKKKTGGFTLIELLVVIAIIALLMAVVLPGLKIAKQKAASAVCLSNVRNLALGWFSYSEDNNGRIMASCDQDYKGAPGWIHRATKPNGSQPSDAEAKSKTYIVTDEDEIRGIREGALYPYLKSADVFNCPADHVKSMANRVDDPEKFVTYAPPRCLGGRAPDFARVVQFAEIKVPSMRYNFIEIGGQKNFTDYGHFTVGAPGYSPTTEHFVWWTPVTINHGNSSTFGFCDGHAEVNKWRDKGTKEHIAKLEREAAENNNLNYGKDNWSGLTSNNSVDLAYMAKGWPGRNSTDSMGGGVK